MTTQAVTTTVAPVGATVAESGDSGQLGWVLNEFAYGLRLASCNGQFRSELAKKSRLRLQNNAIRACHEDHAHLLAQAFASSDAGRRSLLTLRQGQTPSLYIAVIPIRGNGPQRRGCAELILSRASLCETFMLVARSTGLTHAEEQVLGLLSQGKTAPQVASELRVAVSTVRTHIQSLCSKAGCRGLRDLLSTLASLPPLAASPVQILQ